jgi:hypothetical protein
VKDVDKMVKSLELTSAKLRGTEVCEDVECLVYVCPGKKIVHGVAGKGYAWSIKAGVHHVAKLGLSERYYNEFIVPVMD